MIITGFLKSAVKDAPRREWRPQPERKGSGMSGAAVGGAVVGAQMGSKVMTQAGGMALTRNLENQPMLSERGQRKVQGLLKVKDVPVYDQSVAQGVQGIDRNAFYAGPTATKVMQRQGALDLPRGKNHAKGVVVIGKQLKGRSGIIAHELGHASMRGRMPGLGPLMIAGKVLSAPAGAVSGWVTGGDPDRSTGSTMLRGAGAGALGGAVMGAPVLYEEGRASYRGLKALKATKEFKAPQLNQVRNALARAWGTYGLAMTLPAAGAGAAAALARRHEFPTKSKA